jgi:hypothetical protein
MKIKSNYGSRLSMQLFLPVVTGKDAHFAILPDFGEY